MTSEEYGQYIDDFELGADVMPGESLTEYIERRRREFESKADGGSIGIEVLFRDKKADGGRVPMVSGGALKGIMNLFKRGGDDAVDLVKHELMHAIFYVRQLGSDGNKNEEDIVNGMATHYTEIEKNNPDYVRWKLQNLN